MRIWRDRSDKRKSELKQDEIGMGIADARPRVRRQAKAFLREETNGSVLNRESFGERKGMRAVRKGQPNF